MSTLSGEEWEQPADLVLLCAFQLFNVRLLLLSGIGKPYDPATGEGVIGRNYAYQVDVERRRLLRRTRMFNPFIASGAHRHVRSTTSTATISTTARSASSAAAISARCRPTAGRSTASTVPPGTPPWGATGRRPSADNYLSASSSSATHGSCYSYRDNYLDLDPTYKDRLGRPLLRMTFDFHDNELKMSRYLTDRLAEIVQKMGPDVDRKQPRTGPYDVAPYQTTHNIGGAVMGADPKTQRRSTAISRAGTCRTCSSSAPRRSRRTPATTRPGTVGALAYLGGGRDRRSIPEESRPAGAGMRALPAMVRRALIATIGLCR